jgi:hypothetical protein
MILKNQTKNTILAIDMMEITTTKDKVLGLLDPKLPRSLLFHTRWGIHTFGLPNTIDVVILDKDYRVVKCATIDVNSILLWNPLHNIVIELPAGTLKRTKTQMGDLLKWP